MNIELSPIPQAYTLKQQRTWEVFVSDLIIYTYLKYIYEYYKYRLHFVPAEHILFQRKLYWNCGGSINICYIVFEPTVNTLQPIFTQHDNCLLMIKHVAM